MTPGHRYSSQKHRRVIRWLMRLSIVGMACQACLVACKKDKKSSEPTFGPPSLRFEGAENAVGDSFAVGESVVVACDPRITLLLGPSSDAVGLLDNWVLRPPGACRGQLQCGFVRVSLLDAEERVLLQSDQASILPVLDLKTVELAEVKVAKAELINGSDGSSHMVSEEAVVAVWELELLSADCPPSSQGGAGGGGGAPVGTGGAQTGLGGGGGFTGG